ncbi:MAG TPA: SDR family NAD(P)-dependent oxidoreductase [Acidimicrobiales bacterium]|jgi:hypothetical protein|nr:SDR family NAD(P)-dependent oxidoreductase [Acidimicrobiales bacterium]
MTLPSPGPTDTALITGASSGIGADIAHELAARGHGVTLVARRHDKLVALAEELSAQHGVRAEILVADVSEAAVRAALPGRVADLA